MKRERSGGPTEQAGRDQGSFGAQRALRKYTDDLPLRGTQSDTVRRCFCPNNGRRLTPSERRSPPQALEGILIKPEYDLRIPSLILQWLNFLVSL